jgi:hypothetical protein
MPRRIMLSILLLAATAPAARAADLAARQSRLGAIFAEPAAGAPPQAYRDREYSAPIIPYSALPDPVWNRAATSYGSSWSYYYGGPYYGGPISTSIFRLPYVCGLYGYCN